MLYFVEHTDPYLRSFYLFTTEKEPGYGEYHLCMGIDHKTYHIKDYNGETGIMVHKRFIKRLVPIDDDEVLRLEERFGEDKRFEWSIKKIRENLGD